MMHVVIKTIITREELCMGKSCSIQKIAPLWGAPVSGGNALECVCALSGFKGMLLDQAHCKAIGPSCLLQWRTMPETHRMVTSGHHTWDTRSRFDRSTQDRKAYPFEKQQEGNGVGLVQVLCELPGLLTAQGAAVWGQLLQATLKALEQRSEQEGAQEAPPEALEEIAEESQG